MLYLSLEKNQIKIFCLKKSLLGQFEINFFDKKHESSLLDQGKVIDIDLLASAIKEGLNAVSLNFSKEKEVILILPQEVFRFLRIVIPADIAPSAVKSFIKDKTRAALSIDIDDCFYDFLVIDNSQQKEINFFSVEKEVLNKYLEVAKLLDLKIIEILPETLSYYKLFDKTLRKEKRENIFYVSYYHDFIKGYLYDSFGLLTTEKSTMEVSDKVAINDLLREKVAQYNKAGIKINRIILSGPESENIRQDTFTKSIGVWTNPLKRIIPNFYQEYLKLLIVPSDRPFPILSLDSCFGSFVFFRENKNFSILRKKQSILNKPSFRLPNFNLSNVVTKELLLFVSSFIASFILFIVLSRYFYPLHNRPTKLVTITPTISQLKPTATPLPSLKREELKIKILNGSGTIGRASQAKELLSKKGYGEILTGNADSFDYATTEAKIKKSKLDAVGYIKSDLKDYITSINIKQLEDKETADIIIIIGKDFK